VNDELEIYFEKETLKKSDPAVHFHLELTLTEKHIISSLTSSSQKTYNYIFELALTQETCENKGKGKIRFSSLVFLWMEVDGALRQRRSYSATTVLLDFW